MPRYYSYGGQPIQYAGMWKGLTVPGLTRNAAETRGLSADDPEVEYLPWRPSGPEPLEPGESGVLGSFLDGLSDNEKRLVCAGAAVAAMIGIWKFAKRF